MTRQFLCLNNWTRNRAYITADSVERAVEIFFGESNFAKNIDSNSLIFEVVDVNERLAGWVVAEER